MILSAAILANAGAARDVKSQRGIAVITVLLALAIAVLISSEVIMRVYMGMKRSENHFNAQQAWQYALGGEAWARQQLARDFKNDKGRQVDHFFEKWALPVHKMEVPGGFAEVEIYDMQSRFNLNNLVDENGKIVESQLNLFRRLLAALGISTVYADMAMRWASYADDAESFYGTEEAPYQVGDTQFASVSEVRLLHDMDVRAFERLRPFVSALPVPVKININTAPEPVLAALPPKTGNEQQPERLKQFLDKRATQENGFSEPEVFINAMGIQTDDLKKDDLAVSSEYFEVRVRSEYNGRRMHLVSVLFRDADTGEISLLSRDRSQRFGFEQSDIDGDRKRKKDTGVGDNDDDTDGEKDDDANDSKNLEKN